MSASRSQHDRVGEVFLAARRLIAGQRIAFLDEVCGGEPELRAQVDELLRHDSDTTSGPLDREATLDGPGRSASTAPLPPSIGPYRVLRRLGAGGQGVVFLGERRDGSFHRLVAIKLIRDDGRSEEIVRRFEFERQLLWALNHPNIARLVDFGATEDGRPYFAMEYVEGLPIDDFCRRRALDVAARLALFGQVCAAVHYAHQNQVVHRDLKPSNVLVTADGVPKLLDFGIAKLILPDVALAPHDRTRTLARPMTPQYASPEQVRGETVTTASDVYSLGVMLYEILAGTPPYRLATHTPSEIERIVCEDEPRRPSDQAAVPNTDVADGPSHAVARQSDADTAAAGRLRRQLAGDLDNIVLKAMAKAPQRRYGSAEALADDLQRHLDGLPVAARRPSAVYLAGKLVRRHRWKMIAAGAAAFGVVVSAAALGLWAAARIEAADEAAASARRFERFGDGVYEMADLVERIRRSRTSEELKELAPRIEQIERQAREAGVADDPRFVRVLALAHERWAAEMGGMRRASKGDLVSARPHVERALALRERVVASPDARRQDRFALILALRDLGDADDNENPAAARNRYDRAVELARAYLNEAPADADAARLLSILLNAKADTLPKLSPGDIAGRQALYEEGLRWIETALELRPDDPTFLRDRSVSLLRLADPLSGAAKIDRLRQVLDERLHLVAIGADASVDLGQPVRDVMNTRLSLADGLMADGDRPEALAEAQELCEAAVATAEMLRNASPNVPRCWSDLARAHQALAALHGRQGRLTDAVERLRRATEAAGEAASRSTGRVFKRQHALTVALLGDALAAAGMADEARREYGVAVRMLRKLSADWPAVDDRSVNDRIESIEQALGEAADG